MKKNLKNSKILTNITIIAFGLLIYFAFTNIPFIYKSIKWFLKLFTPFIYGFTIAFLLNSPMEFFENKVFFFLKDKHKKLTRGLSVSTSIILGLLIFYILMLMLIPQLSRSIGELIKNSPTYIDNFNDLIKNIGNRFHIYFKIVRIFTIDVSNPTEKITAFINNNVHFLLNITKNIATILYNLILGIIISIYFLVGKERLIAQIKKTLYALFKRESTERFIAVAEMTKRTFVNYINGKLLNSFIIAIITLIFTYIFKMPYALLITVIVGVTDIIPYFGPVIGGIPSFIIIFIANPVKAIYFAVFAILLQQFDGNFLGPKILGDSIGLPSLWVLFAIIIGGESFGLIGIILSVPTFAVFYFLFKSYINVKLKEKDLPTETKNYKMDGLAD